MLCSCVRGGLFCFAVDSVPKVSQMRMESFPATVPRLSPSFLTFSQTCSSIIRNLLQSEEETAAPWWEMLPCDLTGEPCGSKAGVQKSDRQTQQCPEKHTQYHKHRLLPRWASPLLFCFTQSNKFILICKMLPFSKKKSGNSKYFTYQSNYIKVTLQFPWIVYYQN